MNSFLQDLLADAAGNAVSEKISKSLGIPASQADSAISMLMPTLLGGLQKNAQDPQEAEKIVSAVQKDHKDGGILNHIDDLFANPSSQKGDGILSHVLGEKRGVVEQSVAKKSGVDSSTVSQIFTMIAPLVMGELGKKMSGTSANNNASASMLSSILGGGNTQMQEQSFLENMLDRNNDGSAIDDVIGMGMKFFGRS